MRSSAKIFIYNGKGVNQESAHDLCELFSNDSLFSVKPDVSFSDLNFSSSGLINPLFVVPGGSSMMIGSGLTDPMMRIRCEIGDTFHYMGVCAGAFVATKRAEMYATHRKLKKENAVALREPEYLYASDDYGVALNILDDYFAVGAFYPSQQVPCVQSAPISEVPYRVSVSIGANKTEQLYVSGPGFVADKKDDLTSKILADYDSPDTFGVCVNQVKSSIRFFPAVIQRKATDSKGAVLLSGVHLEASVQDSHFLKRYQNPGKTNTALNDGDYQALLDAQKANLVNAHEMIKDTFKL